MPSSYSRKAIVHQFYSGTYLVVKVLKHFLVYGDWRLNGGRRDFNNNKNLFNESAQYLNVCLPAIQER